MERSLIQKEVYSYISKEEGHTMPHRATGEALGLVRRWKDQGKSRAQNLHCVFHGTDNAGQGNSLGLACLSNVGMLQAAGAVSRYRYLALSDLAQGKYWLGV